MINSAVTEYRYDHNDTLIDSISAMTTLFSNLGEICGPIVSGILSDFLGFSRGFALVGLFSAVLFAIFVCFSMKHEQKIMPIECHTVSHQVADHLFTEIELVQISLNSKHNITHN